MVPQEIGVAGCCLREKVGTRHINFVPGLIPTYKYITRFIVHEYIKLAMNILPRDVTQNSQVLETSQGI